MKAEVWWEGFAERIETSVSLQTNTVSNPGILQGADASLFLASSDQTPVSGKGRAVSGQWSCKKLVHSGLADSVFSFPVFSLMRSEGTPPTGELKVRRW